MLVKDLLNILDVKSMANLINQQRRRNKVKINLPTKVRAAIYAIFTIAAPVVLYLSVTGTIGANEVALFTGLSTAVFGLAALNTDTTKEF